MKHKRGDVHPITGKRFWAYGPAYKDEGYWVDEERFQKWTERNRRDARDPEKQNRKKELNRIRLSDPQKAEHRRIQNRGYAAKDSAKARAKNTYISRKQQFQPPASRRRCGDVCPVTGAVFWAYHVMCPNGEYWVSPEKFTELRTKARINRERNRDKINARTSSRRRNANPEKKREAAEKQRAYMKRKLADEVYRDTYNKKNREKTKLRRTQDPIYNMRLRYRRLVHQALSCKGFGKKSRSAEVLGCDWDVFAKHLEAQFTEGMSWENRHLWHIDHILPLAGATTEQELLIRLHYNNTRPMWASENQSKGAKCPITGVNHRKRSTP